MSPGAGATCYLCRPHMSQTDEYTMKHSFEICESSDLSGFSEDAVKHLVGDAAPRAEPQDVAIVLGQIVITDVLWEERLASAQLVENYSKTPHVIGGLICAIRHRRPDMG